jgi:predicted transposase YbfD/YdcC
MDANTPEGFMRWFEDIEDPRVGHNTQHLLSDMLAIAILAAICGAEGWTDVALFGRCKRQWLETFLRLPYGIPSHDTFGRVFEMLKPESFERCFLNWTAHLAKLKKRLVAIDGKTLRHSFDHANDKAAIHMVSAWCQENHLVLGQLATDAKSNEITAIPELLELLDIQGAVVTLDAMGCQKKIAQTIVEAGADYILQVKDNHPTLHQELALLFEYGLHDGNQALPYDFYQQTNKGHGRIETRRIWVTQEIAWFRERHLWPGLSCFICVEATRQCEEKTSVERHYYLGSLKCLIARELLSLIRGHWSIENKVHWSLDVSFREDDCRIRKGHAAENYSRLRRLVINLLKKDNTHKVGLKGKSKACSWDHDYLLKILTQ